MKPSNFLLYAVRFGIACGYLAVCCTAVAHESGDHEQPAKQRTLVSSSPPQGADANLAHQATNPTSSLIQFQLQNVYSPSNNNSSGSANRFVIQPVIPFHVGDDKYFQNVITRTTLPVVHTANPDGPENDAGGDLSDTTLLIVPTHHWKSSEKLGWTWGPVGALQFPTATDNRTGSDKWNAGPGGIIIGGVHNVFRNGDSLQFGGYGYQLWSYAGNSNRENTNKLEFSPVLTYHFASLFGQPDWYVRLTDELWSFDWNENSGDTASIPVGLALGKVFGIGKQKFNTFLAADYYVADRGTDPVWNIKLNVTLLFPE